MQLSLIHDIENRLGKKRCRHLKEELRLDGIFLFDSYLEASLIAFEKGLIPLDAMEKLIDLSQSEFNEVIFKSSQFDKRKRRYQELCDAIDLARKTIKRVRNSTAQ